MLSIPPASIISLLPAIIKSCASMTAFMPEPAHFVYGGAINRKRQARAKHCLPGRRLPLARGQYIADNRFTDVIAINPGPLHGRFYGLGAKSRCAERRETTLKLPMGVRAMETMTTGSFISFRASACV